MIKKQIPWEKQLYVYKKYNFKCIYCGFSGKTDFSNWMQLSLDHILPKSCGGTDTATNLVPACRACNSLASRQSFSSSQKIREIVAEKRKYIISRRKLNRKYYNDNVLKKHRSASIR